MSKDKQPIDIGTKERSGHNRLRPELTGHGYEFRIRVSDQTEIDRLLMNEDITPDQYTVLERFASDLYKAGWVPLRAQSYEPSTRQGGTENLTEDAAVKKLTVAQAIKRIDQKVGAAIRIITTVVALDERELKRDEIRLLHIGVEVLEDFYY